MIRFLVPMHARWWFYHGMQMRKPIAIVLALLLLLIQHKHFRKEVCWLLTVLICLLVAENDKDSAGEFDIVTCEWKSLKDKQTLVLKIHSRRFIHLDWMSFS